MLWDLQQYEEAEAAYRQAIELYPKGATPWHGLGNVLSNLHRYEDAEVAYRKAIELDPKFAYPWNGLGIVLMEYLHRYDEAEAAYRKAIELDPKFAYPWNGLGLLLRDIYPRRTQAALKAFEEGLSLASCDLAECFLLQNKGILLARLGQREEARQSLQKALAGFLTKYNAASIGNILCLPLLLADQEGVAQAQIRVREWADKQPTSFDPIFALFLQAVVEDGDRTTTWGDASARLATYYDRFYAIQGLYDLAGWRPECKERARSAAKTLFDLPPAQLARLKDKPTPEGNWLPYLPFLEGKSDGAGDPRDIPLWENGDAVP